MFEFSNASNVALRIICQFESNLLIAFASRAWNDT